MPTSMRPDMLRVIHGSAVGVMSENDSMSPLEPISRSLAEKTRSTVPTGVDSRMDKFWKGSNVGLLSLISSTSTITRTLWTSASVVHKTSFTGQA